MASTLGHARLTKQKENPQPPEGIEGGHYYQRKLNPSGRLPSWVGTLRSDFASYENTTEWSRVLTSIANDSDGSPPTSLSQQEKIMRTTNEEMSQQNGLVGLEEEVIEEKMRLQKIFERNIEPCPTSRKMSRESTPNVSGDYAPRPLNEHLSLVRARIGENIFCGFERTG